LDGAWTPALSSETDLSGSFLFGGLISAAPTANANPRQASATAVAWACLVFLRSMLRSRCSSNDLGSDIAATMVMVTDCRSPTAIKVSRPHKGVDPYSIGKEIGKDIGNLGVNDKIQERIDRAMDAKDRRDMDRAECAQSEKTFEKIEHEKAEKESGK
jgi:hypothetical protein